MSGARKRTDAPSLAQVCAIIDCALYAFCTARWLNRSITIHFGKGGVRASGRALFEHYRKHAGDWLNKRGFGPAYYVYVFENPVGGGEHVHILMHVPFVLWRSFADAELRWIKAGLLEFGGKYRSGVLVDEELHYYAPFRDGTAKLDEYLMEGLRNSVLYLLKGFGEGLLPLLGVGEAEARRFKPWLSPQGCVIGKRAGFSESLSRRLHLFPRKRIRSDMWMAGPEAHSRAILREFGLEFTAARLAGDLPPSRTAGVNGRTT